MVNFIVKSIRFLIISLMVYIPLVIVWAEWDYESFIRKNVWYELNAAGIDSVGNVNSYGHMFSRIKEARNTKNIDLLVIGASQAYRGFDTRLFREAGYQTFNLGSSNQTPLQTEVLLKRYLDTLNPDALIYVVYPEVFEVDGVESSLDLIANDKIDLGIVVLALKQGNLKLFNTIIYAGYRELFGLNARFKEPVQKGNDTYVAGGYVEKLLSNYAYHSYKSNTWNSNREQFKAFERSLNYIKERGINVILIQTPTPKAFYTSHTNNDWFDNRMEEYGDYYNFNNRIQLDDSLHFYDEFHMNQLGVEIFNKKLIELIKK